MIPDFIKRFGKEKPDFEDVLLLLLEQARKGGKDTVKATLKILVKHKLIDLRKFMRELEDLIEKLTLMGELTPINNKANVEEAEVEEIDQQIEKASEYVERIEQQVGSIRKEKLRKIRDTDMNELIRKTTKVKEHKQEQEFDNVIPFPGPGM